MEIIPGEDEFRPPISVSVGSIKFIAGGGGAGQEEKIEERKMLHRRRMIVTMARQRKGIVRERRSSGLGRVEGLVALGANPCVNSTCLFCPPITNSSSSFSSSSSSLLLAVLVNSKSLRNPDG